MKKFVLTIVTAVMIFAMITSVVYADEPSDGDYYIEIISESLEELKTLDTNGLDAEVVANRLYNKIRFASEYKDSFLSSDLDRLNKIIDEVYSLAVGKPGFESVLRTIDEFRSGPKKEEEEKKEDSANEAPKNEVLVQNFSDVKPGDWFYETVMEMTARGYFAGKGEIVNGVGTFKPHDIMTIAEFNAVIARILFGDIANERVEGKPWWYRSDALLRGWAVIGVYDFTDSVEVPMTREEMAHMSKNTLVYAKTRSMNIGKGFIEGVQYDGAKDIIPDYGTADNKYLQDVAFCYAQGILGGVDSQGTFKPKGYLTRAEAATVIYRLLESKARTPVDLSAR